MKSYNFSLIGHPVGHSISPEIHQGLFNLSDQKGDYAVRDIDPAAFDSTLGQLRGLDGFNITIPYKEQIMKYLDSVDEQAKKYGAVNTVQCENGRFHGFNTDGVGFLRALKQAQIGLSGNVLLCGSGGAAHMMAYEALSHGCRLVVATRTFSKAQNFVDDLISRFPKADVSASTLTYCSGSFDLILNATPCGMYPDVRSCPVPVNVARSAKAVFDAVYNPVETVLIRKAREAGARVQGGLPMLVWQAAAAQEIWTGARFQEKSVEALCKDMEGLVNRKF